MRSSVDMLGSLKYLLLRLNPFLEKAWITHRASGLKFRVFIRDVVGRTILRRQCYEPGLTAWLLAGFEQGTPGIFVDVGANIGWYALQAARSPGVRRVVAFEPDVGNHQLLQANIERNGMASRIDAVACAAGSEPGLARLHRYKASNLGRHSLLEDSGHGGGWIALQTVDGVLEHLGLGDASIAAMKMDVEGYEPLVLAGACNALHRTDALLVELSPALSEVGGIDLGAMLDTIAAAGFVPEVWDGPGALPGFEGLRGNRMQVTVGFRRPSNSAKSADR